jgi:hypothetical protein
MLASPSDLVTAEHLFVRCCAASPTLIDDHLSYYLVVRRYNVCCSANKEYEQYRKECPFVSPWHENKGSLCSTTTALFTS